MSTAVKKKSAALDKIVVKRPVPPPELLQGAPPTNAFNPEFEQKPLAELNLQTSEDFHGGSEQTFSMPSRQGGGGSLQNSGGGGTQQQVAGVQQHQDFGGDFRQQEDGEAVSDEDVRQDDAWQHDEDVQQQEGSDAELQSPGSEEAEGGAQQASWQQEDAQQHQRSHTSEGDVEEWEEFDGDVEEGGGDQTGAFNTAQVVDVKERSQMPGLRRLQTEFYRMLEMLAEEKTRYFDPSLVGGLVKAEYNVKKMALRRYEGKPPTRYKAPRVREAVVLLLDNSGSMVGGPTC